MEDHLLRHVTPAPPTGSLQGRGLQGRLVVLARVLGKGVVTLEDHPKLCHVTGSLPLQLLQRLFRLVGLREKKNELFPLKFDGCLQARPSLMWLCKAGKRCWVRHSTLLTRCPKRG